MKKTLYIIKKGYQAVAFLSLKPNFMKNRNITLNEIGLFLSCILMVAALIYIRTNS
ncbi:hypothetical protein [Flavobacterium sp. NRK F7]|uniref:hypothetical protein n=1 Tax=Flavobacterium sp. NRK F7 TaxID=2954930 RepID=UPI0020917431|nr:hypothetical protein [Flavobacterium sp. NRK F7]MCO6163676.1 hypothetical protein [Flavobacterium sp. NRK F7]